MSYNEHMPRGYKERSTEAQGKTIAADQKTFDLFKKYIGEAEAIGDKLKARPKQLANSPKNRQLKADLASKLRKCDHLRQWVVNHDDYSKTYSRVNDLRLKYLKPKHTPDLTKRVPPVKRTVPTFSTPAKKEPGLEEEPVWYRTRHVTHPVTKVIGKRGE